MGHEVILRELGGLTNHLHVLGALSIPLVFHQLIHIRDRDSEVLSVLCLVDDHILALLDFFLLILLDDLLLRHITCLLFYHLDSFARVRYWPPESPRYCHQDRQFNYRLFEALCWSLCWSVLNRWFVDALHCVCFERFLNYLLLFERIIWFINTQNPNFSKTVIQNSVNLQN